LEALERKKISTKRLAVLRRWALRAYDACETGDLEEGVGGLFERLEKQKY
jgi:hypothetical protein